MRNVPSGEERGETNVSQARAGEACGVDNRIFTIKNLQLSTSSSSNEITLSLWGRVMHKIVKIIYGMKLQFS